MAASLEGETQQPAFRLDSLNVPHPSSHPSSQTSNVDYADLDRSLAHRPFMPPTSSPAPESADPEHDFLPGQIRHADSARTEDVGYASLGESTALLGQQAVAQGNMLRTGSGTGGPPLRKTGSGSVFPTWATQRQQVPSSRAGSPVGSGPSRPSSRALDRVMRQDEEDQLDSSSPASVTPFGPDEDQESTPNVPTPPASIPHSHRASKPTTPAKQTSNSSYKPVSAHKPTAPLAMPPTAGPSNYASRRSRSPNKAPTLSTAPLRTANRRTAPAPPADETQESFFGMDMGMKGRQMLDRLDRERGMWKRAPSAPIKRGLSAQPSQEPAGGTVDAGWGNDQGEALRAGTEEEVAETRTVEVDTAQSAFTPPSHFNAQPVASAHRSQSSATSPTPQPLRRATARKVIPDSSDTEQDGEQEQSVLFTQLTHRSGQAAVSDPVLKTPSGKEVAESRNILDDVSVSDMGGIAKEMLLPCDTYLSQNSQAPDGEAEKMSQDQQDQAQPSSVPEAPASSPIMPRVRHNPHRFGQYEETLTSLPPQSRQLTRRLGSSNDSTRMESPPGSYDAMPDRNELFSSQGGSLEFTQQSSRSNMDHSFQATQYVAKDSTRGRPAKSLDGDMEHNGETWRDTSPSAAPDQRQSQARAQSQTQINDRLDSDSRAQVLDDKSQSLQSNGTANESHGSSSAAQNQTQTQIATEDSQRRAQEAAMARQKEREASLEQRRAAERDTRMQAPIDPAHDEQTIVDAQTRSTTEADPPEQLQSSGRSLHLPRVQPHRMLRRTGSRALASAPFPAMTEVVRPAKHAGLSESLSETNLGQAEGASLPLRSTNVRRDGQPKGDDEQVPESHGSDRSGSALFTLPAETSVQGDGAGHGADRHRRMRSVSSNAPEPTSSMQADDLIPLGVPTQTQTQRSEAVSNPPSPNANEDGSQQSDQSQPVKKAGVRRGRRLAQIEEVSSPPAADVDVRVTRDMSSPPRSNPPTPPAGHGADEDVDMEDRNGSDRGASDAGEMEEKMASRRSDSASSRRPARSMPQTLEPTLLNAETARSLVTQPRMATPTRKYGARAADPAPIAPASPHVKANRMLKRVRKDNEHAEPAVPAPGVSGHADRDAVDADPAGSGVVEAGEESEEMPAKKAGRGSGPGGRKSRRVMSPSSDADEDVDMEGAAADKEPKDDGPECVTDDDEKMDEGREDDEDESPESPPTPEDLMDDSFRPTGKKDKGRAISTAVSSKRKRTPSPAAASASPSPVLGRRSRKKPRKFTPNGYSPVKSTRAGTASRAPSAHPMESGGTSDDEPESPPTPVDMTNYSFVPTAVPRKALKARPSEVASVASTSTSKRANGKAKAAPTATKKGKGRASERATPLPPATRSQSVSASRATAEPTPSLSAGLEDNADGEDHEDDDEDSEDDVEINGPGVFGKYRDSYYAGRIIKRVGNLYQIEFADADTEDLAIGNIRQGILRSGDKVKSNVRGQSQKAIYVVKHDWSYDTTYSEAERDTLITVTHEKTGAERTIPLRHLHIAYRTVLSAWDDRHVDAADFAHLPWSDGTRDRPAATATARPAPKTAIKFVQGTNAFAGQAFMITPRGEDTKRYETLIIRHGGTVCEWQDLFVDASSPNGLNGTSAPKITFGDGLKTAQTPYLITTSSIGGEFEEPKKGEQQGKMKAKIMCALSFGIPCLAPVYIEEALRDHDIRGFLLVPGKSLKHGAPTSQVVDAAWGKEGWDAKKARHELRPLKGKEVLFAGPKSQDLLGIVTACLTGLGAASLKVIDGYVGESFRDYDVVLVAEKGKKSSALPKELMRAPNGCDVQWLKQVCISGEWLPPTLYSWS